MVSLTEKAASEIRATLSEKGIVDFGLRVQVVGGGCEGFLYDLLFVDEPDREDRVFESEGLKVFVDPRSLQAIDGLVIDHSQTPYGLGFVFSNPRALRQCSCGASFGA